MISYRFPWSSNLPSSPGTSPPVKLFSGAGVDTSPSDPAAGDPTSALYLGFHHKIIPRVRTTSDLLDLQMALAGMRGPDVCDFHSMSLCSP